MGSKERGSDSEIEASVIVLAVIYGLLLVLVIVKLT